MQTDPPKSRASGRSGPRTRLGCLTCRQRKVRCDQSTAPPDARSRCNNCVRLELECQYAPLGTRRKAPKRGAAVASEASSRASNAPQQNNDQLVTPSEQQQQPLDQAGSSLLPGSSFSQVSLQQQQPEGSGYGYLGGTGDSMDSLQVERGFGDVPGFPMFSDELEWQPTFQASVMSPTNGLFSTGMLPWRDVFSGHEIVTVNPHQDTGAQAQEQRLNVNTQDAVSVVPSGSSTPRPGASKATTDGADLTLLDVTEHQRHLLLHFTPKANPIPLITSTDSQWRSAFSSLISLAYKCSHLINAICAVSELNLASSKKGSVEQAFSYYQSAADKVDTVLNAPSLRVDDMSLKQAFATLLLLMHAKMMAQPLASPQHWPTTHLRAAHRHLKQHDARLRSWTAGLGSRILSWIHIVDSKAVYSAGMDKNIDRPYTDSNVDCQSSPKDTSMETPSATRGSPGSSNPIQAHTNTENAQLPASDHADTPAEGGMSGLSLDEPPPSAAEIAYDALYQPGHKFFMRCQSLIPRIIALDRHHRLRGPLDAELEVLQVGQRLRSEIRDLWLKRPQGLGVLADTDGLHEVLHPRVARRIIQSFRSFVANFHAVRILLHRVAFIQYPASDEVKQAVSEILRLARDQIGDTERSCRTKTADLRDTSSTSQEKTTQRGRRNLVNEGGCGPDGNRGNSSQEADPPNSSNTAEQDDQPGHGTNESTREDTFQTAGGLCPVILWLWPLFMCGTECGMDERQWILDRMRAMKSTLAERTAMLLSEVTKQQDETNDRVDQRSIRQRIFGGEFDLVY